MLPVTSLSWEEQGRCEKHNVHNGSTLFSVADTVDKNNQSVRRLAPFENERGEAEDTNNCAETTTRLMITAYVFDKSAENIFQFVLVIFLRPSSQIACYWCLYTAYIPGFWYSSWEGRLAVFLTRVWQTTNGCNRSFLHYLDNMLAH